MKRSDLAQVNLLHTKLNRFENSLKVLDDPKNNPNPLLSIYKGASVSDTLETGIPIPVFVVRQMFEEQIKDLRSQLKILGLEFEDQET
jgi:hypothetical protein